MMTPHLLVTLNITDTSVTAQKFDYYLGSAQKLSPHLIFKKNIK